jgi:hypothetical protein
VTKTLERALAQVAQLPEAAQEHIGEELLAYVSKYEALRRDLQEGLDSLDAGKGKELDIEELIAGLRKEHDQP